MRSTTSTLGSPQDGQTARPAGSRAGLFTYAGFVGALGLLGAAYTAMAFGMEWRVERGQIGPGFFPRLVGLLTVVGCVLAIVRAARRGVPGDVESATPADADDNQPTAASRTDVRVTVATVVGMTVFVWFFEVLGALLSSVLFLIALLSVVNRGQHRVNLLVGVLLPLTLHLLFEVLLDAGLPPGLVLPL